MKIRFAIFVSLLCTKNICGQVLTIQSGANFYITASTHVHIDSLVLNPSVAWNVAGPNSITHATTVIHPVADPYISRVYRFANTVPGFSGTVTIYYRDSELNGIPESSLTLEVHNGSNWNMYATGVTRNAVNNFVLTSGLSNISMNEMTLANLSAPLPVVFTLFNARCERDKIFLTWKTVQEQNSSHFDIQRSADGILWATIGTMPAAGTSNDERTYIFTDPQPLLDGFYRVAEKDFDGRVTYTPVLRTNCSEQDEIKLWPNPVQQQLFISITTNTASMARISVMDAKGSLIKTQSASLLPGNNSIPVDVSLLAAGTYFLRLEWNSGGLSSQVLKLVKE